MLHIERRIMNISFKKWLPHFSFSKKNNSFQEKINDQWHSFLDFIDNQEQSIKNKKWIKMDLYWDKPLSFAVLFPHVSDGDFKTDPAIICSTSICLNKILKDLNEFNSGDECHEHKTSGELQDMIYIRLQHLLKEMAIYINIEPTYIASRSEKIIVNRVLMQLLEDLCRYTFDEHLLSLVENCITRFISIDWSVTRYENGAA
ncbi:MAG: hypothetical protein HRU20_18070 [Pseudomonadales bacterium]|nr:hypothetical protein [Pseudomonadales bacterium]